jgi:invasion associated locus B (IalB) protein
VTFAFRLTLSLSAAMALAGFLAWNQPASGQGIERLGEFEDWNAYKFMEKGNVACYIASSPKKAEGKYSKRGDVFSIVTHRPSESRRDEVSFIAGYVYKKDSSVEVSIGDEAFELFTQNDGAWAPDKEADAALVAAMIKGRDMVVKGVSARGTKTTDTYSLSGFTKAYKAINKACGL